MFDHCVYCYRFIQRINGEWIAPFQLARPLAWCDSALLGRHQSFEGLK